MKVRTLIRVVHIVTALFASAGTWFFVLPTSLGGFSTYTVVSGPSMQPTYHTGDLVLARPARNYRIGQVVIYAIPDKQYTSYRVVHRIVNRTTDGRYVTQGDNQPHPDPWLIGHRDIKGGRVLSIPKAGYVLAYMRNPLYLGLLFGLGVAFVAWPRGSTSDGDDAAQADGDEDTDGDDREQNDETGAWHCRPIEVVLDLTAVHLGGSGLLTSIRTAGSTARPSLRPTSRPTLRPSFEWALTVPPLGAPHPADRV